MDKFQRHMKGSAKVTLKTLDGEEDVFTLQPLGFKYLPDVFALMKSMSKMRGLGVLSEKDTNDMTDEELSKIFEAIGGENMGLIESLIMATLEKSYPDEFKTPEGIDKMSIFAKDNMMDLLMPIMDINAPSEGDIKRMEKVKKNEPITKSGTMG